ncbi:phosphatidate cytidylyltransferase [Sphingomonas elodea]|uniref:phosphatidate cytidylyltransferase n=1 Tax=Sphingomonas elodea TaxID=179878 RepID=UPI0002630AB9|nr:phosphatidate cytidylyltransferase [Sphingomonas elodea]
MSKNSDLPKRAVVGLALVGLALAALWAGGWGFWLVVTVMAVLMIGEWALLAGDTSKRRLSQHVLMVPLAILSPAAAGPGFLALGLVFGAFFFIAVVTRNAKLAGGQVYVGLPVLALLLLREHPQGFAATLWAMAIVWVCDSGAYFAGRAIGGPKLAPSISPNKTWAGFVGGLVAAVLFSAAFAALAPGEAIGWWLVLVSPVVAVASQIGDLYESHLKRVAGVKDSGTLLPGHGGILDRLDGLVFAAPVAALCFAIHHQMVLGGFWW